MVNLYFNVENFYPINFNTEQINSVCLLTEIKIEGMNALAFNQFNPEIISNCLNQKKSVLLLKEEKSLRIIRTVQYNKNFLRKENLIYLSPNYKKTFQILLKNHQADSFNQVFSLLNEISL